MEPMYFSQSDWQVAFPPLIHSRFTYLLGSFLVTREFLKYLRSPRVGYRLEMSKVSVVVIGSTSGEFGEESHIGSQPFVYTTNSVT